MSTTRQTIEVGNVKILENSISNTFIMIVTDLEGEKSSYYFDREEIENLKKVINLIQL